MYVIGDVGEKASGELYWDNGNEIDAIENDNFLHLKFTGDEVCYK